MRRFLLAKLCVILAAAAAFAQPPGNGPIVPTPGGNPPANNIPGGPPALDAQVNRLDKLLLDWENRMKGVESIYAKELTRTDKEKGQPPRVLKGEARYLAPNMAALQIVRVDNPQLYEMYICTGKYLYDYRPQAKKLMIYQLPPQQQQNQFNNTFLSFLFGMTARDAKSRFNLALANEDAGYIYINIVPKMKEDMREFARAQMVLYKSTMLPRRLWFEHPNGFEITWDIPSMDTQTKLAANAFIAPPAPKEWQVEQQALNGPANNPPAGQPTGGQPRIIRPSGQR